MRTSWKIGTAFGIGIYVHMTFLLLPLYVLFENGTQAGLPVIAFMMALLAALFGCVVLHELGHALMARHFGIGTRDITRYPIGGVARLEGMGKRPIQELCIALAGPAVNLVIAALLLVLIPVMGLTQSSNGGAYFAEIPAHPLETFVIFLLGANLLMELFNLIPAFPMDGGRVFRALLSMNLVQLRATEIATRVGYVLAELMLLAPLMRMDCLPI